MHRFYSNLPSAAQSGSPPWRSTEEISYSYDIPSTLCLYFQNQIANIKDCADSAECSASHVELCWAKAIMHRNMTSNLRTWIIDKCHLCLISLCSGQVQSSPGCQTICFYSLFETIIQICVFDRNNQLAKLISVQVHVWVAFCWKFALLNEMDFQKRDKRP